MTIKHHSVFKTIIEVLKRSAVRQILLELRRSTQSETT